MTKMISMFAAAVMLTLGMAAFQPSHAATPGTAQGGNTTTYSAEAGAGGR